MKIFAQKLLVGRTFLANQTVTVEDGQITAIGGGGPADFSVWALTPGLVDLHCHGGQGFDPELNERPLPEFLTILLCHGVTDVLLTLGAEPLPTMRRALAVVQNAICRTLMTCCSSAPRSAAIRWKGIARNARPTSGWARALRRTRSIWTSR